MLESEKQDGHDEKVAQPEPVTIIFPPKTWQEAARWLERNRPEEYGRRYQDGTPNLEPDPLLEDPEPEPDPPAPTISTGGAVSRD